MKKLFSRALFSNFMLEASTTKRIAFISVFTALSIITQMFLEFGFADYKFSITIFTSILIGIILGGAFGFVSCFIGDFVGYLVNSSGQIYMFWVGLSTGLIALIAGIIVNGIIDKGKYSIYIKVVLTCILTFLLCTIAVNSTGFYFYNKEMGFSTAVVNYVKDKFGGNVSFFSYVAYRLIFKGQIFNSIFNYALAIIFIPYILKLNIFKEKYKIRN